MRTTYFIFVAILVLCASTVQAADITLVSPSAGGSVDPAKAEFSYSIASAAIINNCTLHIDGTPYRTAIYKDVLRGRSLRFTAQLEEGTHTWSVSCDTAAGIISTTTREIVAEKPVGSEVSVTPSGVFRGSFDHSFQFSNTPEQQPVTIIGVAPGDFVYINLKIPPSIIEKQLYVKQLTARNDERLIILEDFKSKQKYEIMFGQQVNISIGSSTIILKFSDTASSRATLIAIPKNNGKPTPVVPDDQEVSQDDTQAPIVEENTTTVNEPSNPEVSQDNKQETPNTPTTKPVEEPPKQGVVKRILSWLKGILG